MLHYTMEDLDKLDIPDDLVRDLVANAVTTTRPMWLGGEADPIQEEISRRLSFCKRKTESYPEV